MLLIRTSLWSLVLYLKPLYTLLNLVQLDCKTKKGCTALWLAANGGFADVVQALVKAGACSDAQDNRKVSPLMAAFRKSHLKVVKYLVRHVQQFPSDTECSRFLTTVTDKVMRFL